MALAIGNFPRVLLKHYTYASIVCQLLILTSVLLLSQLSLQERKVVIRSLPSHKLLASQK